ncbi:MAG TPA: hypothetical protein VFM85_05105 [Actinomycetota bacterium]|nr:hypothetical protein [Actinomycetota bacterium]
MNRRLEEDLERWEAGLVPLAELEERHPRSEVHDLTELHSRLTELGREATPDPELGWQRLSARLPEPEPGIIPLGPSEPKHRRVFTRRRVAVLGLAAALTLTSGLAAADVLPDPAQDAVANVAGHLGLKLPHSDDVADQTSHGEDHGEEVSNLAHSTPEKGCEKGQAISEVASSFAQDHRTSDPGPIPCDKAQTAGGHSHKGGPAAGHGKGADAGATHASDTGLDHRGSHRPPH